MLRKGCPVMLESQEGYSVWASGMRNFSNISICVDTILWFIHFLYYPWFFSSLSLLSYILLEPSSDIYTGVTQQGEKSRGKTTQAEEMLGKYVHLTHEAVLKKQEITPSFSRREWIMGANIHWGLTTCNKLLWAWNSLYRHIGTQELRAEISLRNEKESGN